MIVPAELQWTLLSALTLISVCGHTPFTRGDAHRDTSDDRAGRLASSSHRAVYSDISVNCYITASQLGQAARDCTAFLARRTAPDRCLLPFTYRTCKTGSHALAREASNTRLFADAHARADRDPRIDDRPARTTVYAKSAKSGPATN